MSKHTPGEWSVRPGGTDVTLRIVAKNDLNQELIAQVPTYGEGRQNAKLIAAAPEMLQALHKAHLEIISLLNEGDFKRNVELDLGYLVDAIAKAEGR